ncbi:MAG: hypothetical protein IMF06_05430 [Proteobacteria bacterium]|nr:hypothetical protein [Pseudomonadota bacterium]
MTEAMMRNASNEEMVGAFEYHDDPLVRNLCKRLQKIDEDTNWTKDDEIHQLEEQIEELGGGAEEAAATAQQAIDAIEAGQPQKAVELLQAAA